MLASVWFLFGKSLSTEKAKSYIEASRLIASWAQGSESEKEDEKAGAKRRPFRTTYIETPPSHLNAESSLPYNRPVYTIPSDARYPHSLLTARPSDDCVAIYFLGVLPGRGRFCGPKR